MMRRPYFDFRVFAELFASKINAKFILSDTLLRFETIARKEIEYLSEAHPLSFRIDFKGEMEVINPNENLEGEKKSFKIFPEKTVGEIQDTISKKENVFIFSLRKGLATMTLCKDCGETINCEKCLAPVVLYLSKDGRKRMFICNRCGTEKSPETVCDICGSWNLMPLGIGTDTVFEEIKKFFPGTKIFKLDKEIAKNATGAEKIIKEYEENPGSILIGTEMAFFYLKNKIPLSIIASFDSLWSIPNFRMNEKIIQLIISIISKTKNKLIIQTKNEKDPAILAMKNENLLSFVREELKTRKSLNYPPYRRFIKITYWGDKEETINTKKLLKELLQEYEPEIFSGFVAKLKNKYVTNALIKIDPKEWSLPELSANSSINQNLLTKLLSLPPSFLINIDPEDLL
jgi:primosomal protein N' (replication factor Y)